jgi:hypothetical protein
VKHSKAERKTINNQSKHVTTSLSINVLWSAIQIVADKIIAAFTVTIKNELNSTPSNVNIALWRHQTEVEQHCRNWSWCRNAKYLRQIAIVPPVKQEICPCVWIWLAGIYICNCFRPLYTMYYYREKCRHLIGRQVVYMRPCILSRIYGIQNDSNR